jgi:hypothetical protein
MCRMTALTDTERASLGSGFANYAPVGHYDEVFIEVGRRMRQHRCGDKADIGVLVFWNRILLGRWSLRYSNSPTKSYARLA